MRVGLLTIYNDLKKEILDSNKNLEVVERDAENSDDAVLLQELEYEKGFNDALLFVKNMIEDYK